jgi:DNA-binding NtrC family response regulator
MNESIVIELKSDLLSEAIRLAGINNVSLSTLISGLIEGAIKFDKGDHSCPKPFPEGVCIDKLSKRIKLKDAMDDLELKMLKRALLETDANCSRAASVLDISKSGFSQKMKKFNLYKDFTNRVIYEK